MPEILKEYLSPWWAHVVFGAALLIGFVPAISRSIGNAMRWIGAKPFAGEIFVAVFSLALSCVPPMMGWLRPPTFHDEISYLFAAETFSRGRLTNPTPAVWEAFQTFHQTMTPTYASKFPPGQGMALAAGMVLGSPRIGPILTIALACAATCWLARAAMPTTWAIVAGLLAAVHPLVFTWGQVFWGGGVAMLGGAIFCGAVLRLARHARPGFGAIAAVGLTLLAFSRPFEGTLLATFSGVWVLIRAIKRGRAVPLVLRAVPAGLAVLVPAALWMGYYNHRVTGHALTLPYAVHARQYMRAPLFWWQSLNTPTAPAVQHISGFHEGVEFKEYDAQRSLRGFLLGVWRKVFLVSRDLLLPVTPAAALVLGAGAIRRRAAGRLAVISFVGIIAIHFLCTPWMRSAYIGLLTPMFFVVMGFCLQRCVAYRVRRVSLAAPLALASIVTWAAVSLAMAKIQSSRPGMMGNVRRELLDVIEKQPGDHVVFVLYLDGPQELYEWVHNTPDLPSQRVIWAHAIDPATNTHVRDAYPNRSTWLLQMKGVEYQMDLLPIPRTGAPPGQTPPARSGG